METEEILKEVQRATTCSNPNQGKSRSLKGKVMEHMKEELDKSGKDKSKVKYYMSNKGDKKLGKRAKYLDKLTRQEASAIFNARTRMLKVKANYKNKYRDQKCRFCKTEDETQDHILEKCQVINRLNNEIITKYELFQEEPRTLRETAKKIQHLMKILSATP